VTDDATVLAEWTRLRAERAVLRRELAGGLRALEERVKDPFGLRRAVRENPVLSAVIAAGAAAILVRLAVGRGSDEGPARKRAAGRHAESPAPTALDEALHDLFLRVVSPWIARMVDEHFGALLASAGLSTNGAKADPADPPGDPGVSGRADPAAAGDAPPRPDAGIAPPA
jgi:hypothetical protein